jgi:hypothetical protein
MGENGKETGGSCIEMNNKVTQTLQSLIVVVTEIFLYKESKVRVGVKSRVNCVVSIYYSTKLYVSRQISSELISGL